MPSYEIYGYVLLVTKEYKRAKGEFEESGGEDGENTLLAWTGQGLSCPGSLAAWKYKAGNLLLSLSELPTTTC